MDANNWFYPGSLKLAVKGTPRVGRPEQTGYRGGLLKFQSREATGVS